MSPFSESRVLPSIADLCQALPIATFEPGAILIAEGKTSGRLYVLGAVEILKGDFQINVVSDRGAIFGEMSALLDIPHMATVRAATRCTAHVTEGGDALPIDRRTSGPRCAKGAREPLLSTGRLKPADE